MTTSTYEDEEAKKSSAETAKTNVDDGKKAIVKKVIVFALPFLLMLGIAGTGFLFNLYLKLFQPPRYWD